MLGHVWGHTALSDVAARDLQSDPAQQSFGRSPVGFCPTDAVAVTLNEVGARYTSVTARGTGDVRQRSNIGDLIHDVASFVVKLSAAMTLQPGNCLPAGTPNGVGTGV